MQVIVHARTASGSFDASFDGVRMTVPADAKNMHRQLIKLEWEDKGHALPEYDPPGPSSADVDAERDKRIAEGFAFSGNTFQSRPEDLANINGAVSVATIAVISGAQAGDFNWAGTGQFAWLTIENVPVPMDAQTVLQFGIAAALHKTALIWKGRAIKNLDPIPADFATNETRWA